MEGINIVFIIVAAALLLFTLDGYRKGFLRIAMEMAAYILTILLGIWLTPVVGNVIRDHTSVEQALQKRFSESVAESIDQTAEGTFGEVEEYLKSVPLPESWKKSLMEHNNDENYERLGVDTLEEYVGGYMTNIVLNVAAFLIAMLVISMVLHLLMGLLDIIGRIPVIHGINKVAGLGVGLLKGLVIVWVCCLVLSVFSGTQWGAGISGMVEENEFLRFLYNHNLLARLVLGIASGIFA